MLPEGREDPPRELPRLEEPLLSLLLLELLLLLEPRVDMEAGAVLTGTERVGCLERDDGMRRGELGGVDTTLPGRGRMLPGWLDPSPRLRLGELEERGGE